VPSSLTLTDKQHCSAGVSLIDADGQPITTKPADLTVSFVSSDPTVADFVVGPDGMNGDITSGKVGSCIITASAEKAGGNAIQDTISVAVVNSAPGSLNFTPGAPVDETPTPQ
jgi:hypothetical protein